MNDIIMLITGLGGGSIITAIVQSFLNKKRNKADVYSKNLEYITDVNETQNEIIENMQKHTCYNTNCANRTNADASLCSKGTDNTGNAE